MISPFENMQCSSPLILDSFRISNDDPRNRWDSHTYTMDAVASTKTKNSIRDHCHDGGCCIFEKHGESEFLHSARSHPEVCHVLMQCLTWCRDIQNNLKPFMHENHLSFQDWKVKVEPCISILLAFIVALIFFTY